MGQRRQPEPAGQRLPDVRELSRRPRATGVTGGPATITGTYSRVWFQPVQVGSLP
jgi:hypothetical protein